MEKWDLHVDPPGTKLSDGYGTPSDLDRFCQILEDSDVQVFGITDYFSSDAFYAVKDSSINYSPSHTKSYFQMLNFALTKLSTAVTR